MNDILLAKYVILNFKDLSPDGLTHLKLQKLLYYLNVWDIVNGLNFIKMEFYKWDFGPVNKIVYNEFKGYKKNQLEIPKEHLDFTYTETQKNFIEFIIKNYIIFDAYTLSALTHSEEPWQQTPTNKKIEDKLIKEYYGKKEFAKNFPLGAKGKFYPLQTEFFYSFILDMDINKYHLLDTIYKFSDYQKLEEKSKKELSGLYSKL